MNEEYTAVITFWADTEAQAHAALDAALAAVAEATPTNVSAGRLERAVVLVPDHWGPGTPMEAFGLRHVDEDGNPGP